MECYYLIANLTILNQNYNFYFNSSLPLQILLNYYSFKNYFFFSCLNMFFNQHFQSLFIYTDSS